MLVYKTNLGEKLFGYALSKDFVKYNTPFCDLVDDPILGVDIDLAVNFNKSINGNLSARRDFTNTLVLCSGIIDPGTVEFWVDKMYNYPVFKGEIERIDFLFYNLQYYGRGNTGDFDFEDSLKNALKDCLNSPCNIFAPMSDTIGSITNTTPIYNTQSIFPVGSLKQSFQLITSGVSDTVFKRIPEIFQEGIVQISQLGTQAWGDFLDTILFKDNPDELVQKAQGGGLRSDLSGLLYTPDIENLFSLSEMASDVLGSVAEDLGGCFRRLQYATEYNPYSSNFNKATPADTRGSSINGITYDQTPLGQAANIPLPNDNERALGYNGITLDSVKPKNWDGSNALSGPIILGGGINDRYRYTMFGAWLDEASKTIWTDAYNKSKDDEHTLTGTTNIGPILTPSRAGINDSTLLQEALENKKSPSNSTVGYAPLYAQGEKTNTDLTVKKGRFNHGVAINENLISSLLGMNVTASTLKNLQRENKLFVVLTYNGKTHIVQVLDRKGVSEKTGRGAEVVDFTPYAFYAVTGKNPVSKNEVKYGSWTQKGFFHPQAGQIECRIGIGTKQEIEQLLGVAEKAIGGNGTGSVKYVSDFSSRTRNKPLQPQLYGAIAAAAKSTNLDVVIYSGGQTANRRTGKNRHNNGWAADIYIYNGRQLLSCKNEQHIPLLENFARACRQYGCTGAGMGPYYMNSTGLHIDMASGNSIPHQGVVVWGDGNSGGSSRAPAWLRRAMGA